MKKENANRIISFFVIFGLILLLVLQIFLPDWFMMIPNETIRLIIISAMFAVFFVWAVFDIFYVIKNKKYSTTVFIVISNIIFALSIIGMMLLLFIKVKPNELEKIILHSNLKTTFLIAGTISFALREFCKSGKYLRKS